MAAQFEIWEYSELYCSTRGWRKGGLGTYCFDGGPNLKTENIPFDIEARMLGDWAGLGLTVVMVGRLENWKHSERY